MTYAWLISFVCLYYVRVLFCSFYYIALHNKSCLLTHYLNPHKLYLLYYGKICKLIKKSPKRNTKLDDMRRQSKNDSKGIHALCPTRWTVRGEALESILNNYIELMNLWDWSIDTLHDTEMKARICGVQANMPTFDFVYGCCLGIMLLKQTDNLSRTLQDPKMSAAEGNAIAQDVIKTLSKDRDDSAHDLFWERVCKRKDELNVSDPKLPRKRRLPRTIEDGIAGTYHFPSTPKDYYRQIYFQAIDAATNCIKQRFDQQGRF